ncbi:hypothetical protein PCIT_a2924 [Pseudoalteromonas citrea]|uniref:Phage tail protein n=2 Tax=Pseudoalteromonas citrea TaxID=43655 RepID=A0AAD4FRN8_9GAMM|nr:phage tail protein [Pseudoalteromonas citrea]KAF7769991.1 hypothetical protein PCIT_a2924 [Pseudoalteromonas citrea]
MPKASKKSHMMQLGTYKFSVGGAAFETLKFSSKYRWIEQDSQTSGDENPIKQFKGSGEQTLTLDGTIYPQIVEDGLRQVSNMRKEASKGKPLKLTYVQESGKSNLSVGRVLGNWVIESIDEERMLFLNDGIPREIKFSMVLSRRNWRQEK